MTQIGRNDSCPCGSGKKYKKCCLHIDEARMRLAREQVRRVEQEMHDVAARRHVPRAEPTPEPDELTPLTNSVLSLLRERRFEEALAACERLLREYPDVHDGFERSALVHDALGNHALAAEYWAKAVDFVEHPERRDDYDEDLIDDFRQHRDAARVRAHAHAADPERAPAADHKRAP